MASSYVRPTPLAQSTSAVLREITDRCRQAHVGTAKSATASAMAQARDEFLRDLRQRFGGSHG